METQDEFAPREFGEYGLPIFYVVSEPGPDNIPGPGIYVFPGGRVISRERRVGAIREWGEQTHMIQIREVDVPVLLGNLQEPTRVYPPSRHDLVFIGERMGINQVEVAAILARQIFLFQHSIQPSRFLLLDARYRQALRTSREFLSGKTAYIPYFVFHTTSAIMTFGISVDVDPAILCRNYQRYAPPILELAEFRIHPSEVYHAWEVPALLSGSTVITSAIGGQEVAFLRARGSGFYKGKFSFPGGHADTFSEVPALEECAEEAYSQLRVSNQDAWQQLISRATPVAALDQLLVSALPEGRKNLQGGVYHLRRFLNIVWHLHVPVSFPPENGDGIGDWLPFSRQQVVELSMQNQLTPVARKTFEIIGWIDTGSDQYEVSHGRPGVGAAYDI